MATIYELLQNMNPNLNNANQPKMSIQDLIFQEEEKKRQAQAQQPQIQQTNQVMPEQNIPIQQNIQPDTTNTMPQINLESVYGERPKITPEQEPYKTPPQPYSIKDFGKYYKQGKGFWGKVGGGLADLLSSLGTPEGMKLAGLASYGLGGNIYNAKAMADQGDIVAQQQAQQQKQYDDYIKDLRGTAKEYDLKMMDLLGKEAYSALKGGKGLIFLDTKTGKGYLPTTQEDGSIKNIEVNVDEYKRKGYATKDLDRNDDKNKTQIIFNPREGKHGKYYLPYTDKKGNPQFKEVNPNDYDNISISTKQLTPEELMAMSQTKQFQNMQPGTPQYANLATKLSDDYRGDIKDYATLRQNYKTMETVLDASLKNPKMSMMTVDQALITTFNKMLDPGSVVKESEYARTPEGQAKLVQLQGFLDKLKQGGAGLTPKERVAMVQTASKLMDAGNDYYNEKRKSYTDMAKEYGVKPSLVIGKDLEYKPKSFSYPTKSNIQQKPVDKKIENLRSKYQY